MDIMRHHTFFNVRLSSLRSLSSLRKASLSSNLHVLPPCWVPCCSRQISVGIDLGTTSSAIAVIGSDGIASVKAVIPSVVHFKKASSQEEVSGREYS